MSQSVPYQWMKDDLPLVEGEDFFFVSSDIFISQGMEGKYVCCVSKDSKKLGVMR